MPKYIVETISMFRIRYVIEAECAEHAADEVTMEEAKEFSQLHLGEHISSVRQISDEEICDLFFEDHDYLADWPREMALEYVHKVEYAEGSLDEYL